MVMICTQCHTRMVGMAAGNDTLKLECPRCAPELIAVREVLEKLRAVMIKVKAVGDGG